MEIRRDLSIYWSMFHILFVFILHLWMVCLHVCMCTIWVPRSLRGQKQELDTLELELQIGVDRPVGAVDRSRFLKKSASAPNH